MILILKGDHVPFIREIKWGAIAIVSAAGRRGRTQIRRQQKTLSLFLIPFNFLRAQDSVYLHGKVGARVDHR
jgi:hypothetical protein